MNFIKNLIVNIIGLTICMIALAHAGGDKSAKTTVITLAGGGEKSSSSYIPIPIPVCSGRGYGGHSRMGWRR